MLNSRIRISDSANAGTGTLNFMYAMRDTKGKWPKYLSSFRISIELVATPSLPTEYISDGMRYTIKNKKATLLGKVDSTKELGEMVIDFARVAYDDNDQVINPFDSSVNTPAYVVNIPISIIATEAFKDDRTITSLKINNVISGTNVTIQTRAFAGTSIEQLILTYTTFAYNTNSEQFKGCESLEKIIIEGKGNYFFSGTNVFADCPNLTTINGVGGYASFGRNTFGERNNVKYVRLANGGNAGGALFTNGKHLVLAASSACNTKENMLTLMGSFETLTILGSQTGPATTLENNCIDDNEGCLKAVYIGGHVDMSNIDNAFKVDSLTALTALTDIYIEKSRQDATYHSAFTALEKKFEGRDVSFHYTDGEIIDTFYVSNILGDDRNLGTRDAPFKTIKGYLDYLGSLDNLEDEEQVIDKKAAEAAEAAERLLKEAKELFNIEYTQTEDFKSSKVKNKFIVTILDTITLNN